MQLLFAMHDVSPFHLERLRLAEALLVEWGVRRATYLLMPNYLGLGEADQSPEFLDFVHGPRALALRWFLHGYYHLAWRDGASAPVTPLRPGASPAEIQCANNDEFLELDEEVARRRLARGQEVFRACIGRTADAFVAPRWNLDPGVMPVLREEGFTWTEAGQSVIHLPSGTRLRAPVITWATRTPIRKAISLAGVRCLSALTRAASILRIAVHPFDFDHPETVRSIERTVRRALSRRTQAFYEELAPLCHAGCGAVPRAA